MKGVRKLTRIVGVGIALAPGGEPRAADTVLVCMLVHHYIKFTLILMYTDTPRHQNH